MTETPYVSLSEAAKITGRSKSTLSKALASGKMSYVSKDPGTGAFAIDPAEALRVFPRTGGGGFRDRDRTGANGGSGKPPIALEGELAALRQKLEAVERERTREREQLERHIEDLRARAERAERKEDQLQALLTDQREKAAERPRRGLWGFLRRGAAPPASA